MFEFLTNGDGKKLVQRTDFIDRIDNVVGAFTFEASKPLNLNKVVTKGSNQINAELAYRDLLNEKKELEKENTRLKRAVADLTLDKLILKEAVEGNY